MGYRLSKIVTRKGDDGTTSLAGQSRLPKNHLCIEAVGTLDELNASIGILRAHRALDSHVISCLIHVQNDLFDLGGELCPPHRIAITAEKTAFLEHTLEAWNGTLPPLKEFILPGDNLPSAYCHLARTICRRAERVLVALHQQEALNPEILRYINRLSDFLFVLARVLAKDEEKKEVMWEHKKRAANP